MADITDVPFDRLALLVLTGFLTLDRALRWVYKRETSDSAQAAWRTKLERRVTRLRQRVQRLEHAKGLPPLRLLPPYEEPDLDEDEDEDDT